MSMSTNTPRVCCTFKWCVFLCVIYVTDTIKFDFYCAPCFICRVLVRNRREHERFCSQKHSRRVWGWLWERPGLAYQRGEQEWGTGEWVNAQRWQKQVHISETVLWNSVWYFITQTLYPCVWNPSHWHRSIHTFTHPENYVSWCCIIQHIRSMYLIHSSENLLSLTCRSSFIPSLNLFFSNWTHYFLQQRILMMMTLKLRSTKSSKKMNLKKLERRIRSNTGKRMMKKQMKGGQRLWSH